LPSRTAAWSRQTERPLASTVVKSRYGVVACILLDRVVERIDIVPQGFESVERPRSADCTACGRGLGSHLALSHARRRELEERLDGVKKIAAHLTAPFVNAAMIMDAAAWG